MKPLKISGTDNTPQVDLDLDTGNYVIQGESRPENVAEFYKPVKEWIENWGGQLYYRVQQFKREENHRVKFRFEYFNSSSAKYIMDLILKINEINTSSEKINVEIDWVYDEMDEDIEQAGREFEELTSVKFNFISK